MYIREKGILISMKASLQSIKREEGLSIRLNTLLEDLSRSELRISVDYKTHELINL